VSWPTAKAERCEVTLKVVDFNNFSMTNPPGVPGVVVRYCGGNDQYCSMPIAHGTTNPAGVATLDVGIRYMVNVGLTGNYFEVPPSSSQDSGVDAGSEATLPELLFLGFPLSEAKYSLVPTIASDLAFITDPFPVVNPAQLPSLVPTPGHGALVALIVDCNAEPTPAGEVTVTLSSSPGKMPLPFDNLAIFQDLDPGYVTVTATPKALGKPSSSVPVQIRDGFFTGVILAPTP
jgi:hypothetical protein